jgi:ketosteroid isomerase-like protein
VKKLTFLILCGVVMVGVGSLVAANDPKDEKAVMATLEAMAKATVTKDVPTLAKIYGDDLTYSHSSALTQNKDVVLKAITGGEGWSMKFSDTTIRIYGDVALAKGVTDFRNGQPGKLVDNHLNILWVLVRRPQGPFGWQIVARQTTRIEEPAAGRGGSTSSNSRGGAPAAKP